ncbi:MAG: ABC transporter permease subunit [Deltaproteobacteria bacterium]|nr:ABC transporter permease subunit [Deltaproteobacteria bacterium]
MAAVTTNARRRGAVVIGRRALARLAQMAATLLLLSFALFGVMEALPGDPVDLLVLSNPNVQPDDVARLKRLRGLDRPWPVRWWRWLVGHPQPLSPPKPPQLAPVVGELAADGAFELDVPLPTVAGATVEPIGGLVVEGGHLRAALRAPGAYQVPLLVRDVATGLEALAWLEVLVAPPDPATLVPPEQPATLDDDDRQLGGSTEHAAGVGGRGEAALASAARSGPQHGVRVARLLAADASDAVDVELATLGLADAVTVVRGPGRVERGRLIARFDEPGQTVIGIELATGIGTAVTAVAVDHGTKPSSQWQRGALFALVGDTEALGWSSTYKRPVWELLFGAECAADCGATLPEGVANRIGRLGRVQNTVALVLPAFLLSLLLAIPLGTLAALRKDGALDRVVGALSLAGLSVPAFWLGMIGIVVLAAGLQVLPAGGIQTPGLGGDLGAVLADRLWHAVLPTLVLTLVYAAQWLRFVRAGVLEALPLDFVRTARAKGLGQLGVARHALRTALVPLVTVVALAIPQLFAGALLTETVFAWPGVGRLQYEAILHNDSYVAVVVFLVSALLVMAANLAADLLHAVLDPRVRRGPA